MNADGAGDSGVRQKRAAESYSEERMEKLLRTEMAPALNVESTMAGTQTMFARPQQQSNLFFMGSQSQSQLQDQQSMLSMESSVPMNQVQHLQIQAQQRQQQQQYATAMAAQRNAQQQHGNRQTTVTNEVSFQSQHSEIPQQQMQGAHSTTASPLLPQARSFQSESSNTDEVCSLCGEKDCDFTCNGGCGLHVHSTCIGEDAIFSFVAGRVCGSCFIVQQNRACSEDLTKGGPHALSVRRAILCINLETNSNTNFDKFGHLASLRLGEIGSIAGYPIKPFAEKFVEPYLQRWMREKLATADKWMLNVREIFTVMIGLYSLKRACIAHGLHDKVIELMKSRKFTVIDYFGWHPAIEGPSVRCSSLCAICGIRNAPDVDVCSRCHHKLVFPSIFTKYISTLLAAFYAEQVGVPLEASSLDVFAHTNFVRGLYKGLSPFDADGVTWDVFTDQLRMIFGLLDIMSNFGTLQLNPDLFGPEVNIIFNAAYVNQAMISNEFEVVGKFLQCMKLFGNTKSAESQNMIESCERYLLFKHLPDGSWCKINGSTVDQYKATVTCSKALLAPAFRGFGPVSSEFLRFLEKWARSTSPKLPSTAVSGAKQPADMSNLKVLASGATVKLSTRTRLKRLEAMYQRLAAPKGGNSSLEFLMTDRMKQLLKLKKNEAQPEQGKSVETNYSSSQNEMAQHVENVVASKGSDTSVAVEEGTADGMTDSEDLKSDHPSASHDRCNSRVPGQDDDDMLTSMSLHEDLEIFDGLQFEDGGGIIDVSFQSLVPHGEADNGNRTHSVEGYNGTDAPGQDEDETMDEQMIDDDEDENESSEAREGGDHQGAAADETADTVNAMSDFPEM
ncbi:hypothetical protein CCR75_000080 [Bremia lactucae]|uniref:Uncharacterized protein n=1 Tax=Bremia lactucae TaxID=4779 RepID=A0A976FIX5_BRELC|nr:hypothetical protein CCR75_000080 [Bremia lactucae]